MQISLFPYLYLPNHTVPPDKMGGLWDLQENVRDLLDVMKTVPAKQETITSCWLQALEMSSTDKSFCWDPHTEQYLP